MPQLKLAEPSAVSLMTFELWTCVFEELYYNLYGSLRQLSFVCKAWKVGHRLFTLNMIRT
jgi:hypothetical protein